MVGVCGIVGVLTSFLIRHVRILTGFQDQHQTIKKFLVEAKKHPTLMAEFKASRVRLIKLMNDGTVSVRVRGDKKKTLEDDFTKLRKSVVESIKARGDAQGV